MVRSLSFYNQYYMMGVSLVKKQIKAYKNGFAHKLGDLCAEYKFAHKFVFSVK